MSNIMDIRTENLIKTFDGLEIIKNLRINVPQGSIYGLLGANGSGKTTVFKLLLGLLKPTAGSAEVLGMDTVNKRNEILKNVGNLIEVPIFYEHLSARENLEIHLAYMGFSGDITQVLELVGLKASNSQPVSKFSLGMRQRLDIARALEIVSACLLASKVKNMEV